MKIKEMLLIPPILIICYAFAVLLTLAFYLDVLILFFKEPKVVWYFYVKGVCPKCKTSKYLSGYGYLEPFGQHVYCKWCDWNGTSLKEGFDYGWD